MALADDLQEIVITDFSPGIFSAAEFASHESTPDGAAAEFLAFNPDIEAVAESPDTELDITRLARTAGEDLDISGLTYTYGCVGTERGLRPGPKLIHSLLDQSAVQDSNEAHWRPFMRQVVLATAILSPVVNPNQSEGSSVQTYDGGVAPFRHPDQIHVLSACFHDNLLDGFYNPRFVWRVYSNVSSSDTPEWVARNLVFTTPPNHLSAASSNVRAHVFASGGLTPIRIDGDFGFGGLSVVAVFGQDQCNYSTDGWQAGAPTPGIEGNVVNAQWGTWRFPYQLRFAAYPIDPDANFAGDAYWPVATLSHQNRIVTMLNKFNQALLTDTTDPLSFSEPSINEVLVYNDRGNPRYTFQDDSDSFTFLTDAISGFGSWVSMNATELFFVKNRGGGLVLRGTVAEPQQVNLPGVESCYGAGALGAVCPLGYVYGTRDGVHLWGGGDTTEHLSQQLGRRWFWNMTSSVNDFKVPNQPKGKFAYRYPFVYVSNNWLLDIRTKSWWRLTPPSDTADYFSYEVSASGDVYGFNGYLVPEEDRVIYSIWSSDEGTDAYRWISQPLVRTRNRVQEFRQVRVTAIGKSDVRVILIGRDGSREVVDFPAADLSNTTPRTLAAPVRIEAEDVTVMVEVTNPDGGPAAVIHRIALSYRDTMQVQAV